MAQKTESVVTPERFATGMSFAEWMERINLNKEKFQASYDAIKLDAEETKALKELSVKENGPARLLIIGEDWCPDVFRGLPVLVRIAEAAGWEIRIFWRDENPDIMNEFLKDGEFQSIPVGVFYTKDHRYIGHWIERPALANQEMHVLRAITDGRTREESRADYEAFQAGPVWQGWRKAIITEIIDLLEQKVR
ncbi:MAG TPA: thioredoxin family protein [Dehalococcoidia bacterium]|nr:thioredoxin family protein [Dehalococcoidia bacterium]